MLYLIGQKGPIPPRDVLEEINYKCIIIGFPMLTSGILTGAVWAQYAWGSYWSWDPKGNMVAHNVDDIRTFFTCQNDERMERQDERDCIRGRLCERYGHLFCGKFYIIRIT